MDETELRLNKAHLSRLVIVDELEVVCVGFRTWLCAEAWLEVLGEATTTQQALDLCRTIRPNLALIDAQMPELDGIAITRSLRQSCPETKVVILSRYANADEMLEALQAGATGYLRKNLSQGELIRALQRVAQGESIFNDQMTVQLFKRLAADHTKTDKLPSNLLTPREMDVLRLLAEGLTNSEIAKLLAVSVGTSKIHVEHIVAKLGVSNRTQAAIRALEVGLLVKHKFLTTGS